MCQQRLLEVENLAKTFKGKRPVKAVDGVSFNVAPGEIVGILGANGAGKSTTIQMLLGTLTPTTGILRYFGKCFQTHRSEILEQVGYASGYSRLPYSLTVRENLDIFGRLYGVSARDRTKRINELLEYFGVAAEQKKTMSKLSAGQITRVMLAKAFMARPLMVLLDEPTASLDPEMCADVRTFVLRQKREYGVSMVYTSHNMAEVTEVCDRVIFLRAGKIVAEDSPQELARKAAATVLRLRADGEGPKLLGYMRAKSLEAGLTDGWVEISLGHGRAASLLGELSAEGLWFSEIEVRKPTLEDYFIKISKGKVRDELVTSLGDRGAPSTPLETESGPVV